METPRFSVIIPALNEEKFLPKLLVSLAAQTKKNFEVIVVDGNSIDRTVEVARKFASKLPFLAVEISSRASLPLQRNLGAKKARAEWFIFIDADSIVLPYFIDRVEQYIDSEKPKLFTTWVRPDSEVPGDALLTLLGNMFVEGSIILKRQLSPGPLTVVDRQDFEKVGGYDENLKFGEDFDFAQRLAENSVHLKILRETLYVWSMRRIRREGKLKMLQFYAKVSLQALLTKKISGDIPGYIMGGHLYGKGKNPRKKKSRVETLKHRIGNLTKGL